MKRSVEIALVVVLLIAAVVPAAAGGTEVLEMTGASGCVTHVRWIVTEARNLPFMQAAEVALFDGDVRLPSGSDDPDISVTSPGGFSEMPPEGPEAAYDGSPDTKWIDFALNNGAESTLLIRFPEPVTFDSYHWVTASSGGESGRDPVSWRLDVSTDGVTWVAVDTRSDVEVTEVRSAVVGPFDVTSSGCGPSGSGLVLDPEPSTSVVSGQVFDVQPVVQLVDADGEAFAEAGVVVTAAIESGGGSLGGTLVATTDAAGRAVFTDLTITGSGEHTLGFSAPDLDGIQSGPILVALTRTGRDFGSGRSAGASSGPGENRNSILALEPRSRGRVR